MLFVFRLLTLGVATADHPYDPHTDLAQVLRRMPFLTQPWSPLTTQGSGFGFHHDSGLPYTLS